MSSDVKQSRRAMVESAEKSALETFAVYRQTTVERGEVVSDLLQAAPSIGIKVVSQIADGAAVDERLCRLHSERLKYGYVAAESEKAALLVKPDDAAAVVSDLFDRRATKYGAAKQSTAKQQAKRDSAVSALLETFNVGADGSAADPTLSAWLLLKVMGSFVEETSPGCFDCVRPTFGADGRKIRGQSVRLSPDDIAAVRKAARYAYGERGGVDETRFKDNLRLAGLLPPAKVQPPKAKLNDSDLDELFKADRSATVDVAAVFANVCRQGELSASEALAVVRSVVSTFGRIFAPTVDHSESAAADIVRDILAAPAADDAAADDAAVDDAAADDAAAAGRVDDAAAV